MRPRRHKKRWISDARKLTEQNPKQPCLLCHKFIEISEIHHLIPLSLQYKHGIQNPDTSFVWLCPNCHKIVHKFISNNKELDIDRDTQHQDLSFLEAKYPRQFKISQMCEQLLFNTDERMACDYPNTRKLS